MEPTPMLWNFEELGESDSLGTSAAGSKQDPISSLLANIARDQAGMLSSAAGGRALQGMGLAPTPPLGMGGDDPTDAFLSLSAPTAPVLPNASRLSTWAPLEQQPAQAHSLQHSLLNSLYHPGLGTTSDVFHLVKCPICREHFRDPRVLACFHSFCKECLEHREHPNDRVIMCPQCHQETQLSPNLGIDGLLSDYGLQNAVNQSIMEAEGKAPGRAGSLSSSPGSDSDELPGSNLHVCTGCKSGDFAKAFCGDCRRFLCQNCTQAHTTMHCFDGHHVEILKVGARSTQCNCLEHRQQPLQYFCITCNFAICHECTMKEHQNHTVEKIDDVAEDQMQRMEDLIAEATKKQANLHDVFRLIDSYQTKLTNSFQQAQNNIDEFANSLILAVQEARKVLYKDLETTFAFRQLQITVIDKDVQKMTKRMSQTIEFTQRLLKYCSPTEVMVFKPLVDQRLQNFLNFNINTQLSPNNEIEPLQVNSQQARQMIYNCLMNSRPESWLPSHSMPPATQRPPSDQLRSSPNGNDSALGSSCNNLGFGVGSNSSSSSSSNNNRPLTSSPLSALQQTNFSAPQTFGGASAPAQSFISALEGNNAMSLFNNYEKWSSGLELTAVASALELGNGSAPAATGVADLEDKVTALSIYPPRSQIKRQKMTYHCKFGEFGVMEGQFTEPSGVAVSAQNDIIVADTNNHRIQVFNKEGHFKFQFGECGKRDGQLLYPNRVSVNRQTGDFIVTERSPTHQIQVYNQYGHFLRKFGANILQHPRGVCVDHQGRIIVVECKVMRVLIFDMHGNILHKFSCSRYLEFPNGVCANDKNEIFISDNRAHCIKVFNYEGQYLRQIGGEGVTNYPIGVGINAFGEVVVADNHNNFNLTIFNQNGELLNAMESKVKHAQCFDVALLEDGSVVLASKDYRLYLYRYQSNAI
ncbi:unnamed protein product [Bursaphelenchus xylophilus]|uniref:(pine wood nematode) hypothetical protein n=1 Tax=Bursaphelenchus xylophilus TaxID=6326 RepID=A0A1I7RV47_BURXY|nr:unnamed protein product [Bursaphelenchus xylophilus]CAG9105118.1 unnamed protein product [Bursaphelenchus xylophilus]